LIKTSTSNHLITQSYKVSGVKAIEECNGASQIEKGLRQLTAIVAISFQGAVPINAELMSNWLGDQVPDGVASIKVRAMHIESIYESWSTFMEVAIPLWLWACLADMPGCTLVGFVKSRNLIAGRTSNEEGGERKACETQC
jgi:hypothetical protein